MNKIMNTTSLGERQTQQPQKPRNPQQTNGRGALFWVVTIIAFIAIGGSIYLYKQVRNLKNSQNPQANYIAQEKEQNELKKKIGKLINLPDEKPTVANVTDREKLKDQPFFKDAENGDRLLIFPAAKKAIIYRESENRLINVGPIAITSDKEILKKEDTKPAEKSHEDDADANDTEKTETTESESSNKDVDEDNKE